MPISKTDFIRGLQCEKMLWLDAHAPEHKIIPPEVQAKLDAGNDFGDNAMGIFGDFIETTTFREDGRLHFSAMIEKTQQLVAEGTDVICEGAFTWYGNFCAADILRREGEGYILYEVKNAFTARGEFVTDLGFQRLLLRKCGVNVLACKLILRGDTPPEDCVLSPDVEFTKEEFIEHAGFTYRIVDVTKGARIADKLASDKIFELGKLKRKDMPMPEINPSEHCEKPYRCWYYDYCHKV
ncbi:MAG: hypothetical protein E7371_05525 [Clostridiales bacterium]|nr:hypothetical protein [Clostridiales bacterium]